MQFLAFSKKGGSNPCLEKLHKSQRPNKCSRKGLQFFTKFSKGRVGVVKGFLNNVQKTAELVLSGIPYNGRRPRQNNCHHRCIGIGQRGQTISFTFHSFSPLLKSAQKIWRIVQKIHLNNKGRPIKIKIIALSIRAAECNFWQSDAAT